MYSGGNMLNYYVSLVIRSTLVLGIIILVFNTILKFLLILYWLSYEEVEEETKEEIKEGKE